MIFITNNKITLITNKTQKINFKITKHLIKNNFKITIINFNKKKTKTTTLKLSNNNTKTITIKTNISNHNNIFNTIKQTTTQFNNFHIIINNTNLKPTTPINTITKKQFKTIYNINITNIL